MRKKKRHTVHTSVIPNFDLFGRTFPFCRQVIKMAPGKCSSEFKVSIAETKLTIPLQRILGIWRCVGSGDANLVRMHMRTVNDIYINLKVSFNFEYVKFLAMPKHFSVAHLLINAVNATLLHIQLFKWWITWHGKVVKDYRRRDTILSSPFSHPKREHMNASGGRVTGMLRSMDANK